MILIAVIIQSCCKQSTKEYYSDVNRKEIYFSSYAKADDVFWIGNDGQQLAKIDNGEYHFESLVPDARFNAPEFPIRAGGDFEIEASLTGVDDDSLAYFGMVIGQLKDSTFINFKINNSGSYVIEMAYPVADGKFENTALDRYKKLTVRKRNNELLFFINENITYSYPVDKFINLRTGPLTAPNSIIWVDYFKVSELID